MNRAWQLLEQEDAAMLAINMGEVIEQWSVKGLPTTCVIAPVLRDPAVTCPGLITVLPGLRCRTGIRIRLYHGPAE